MLLVVSSVVGVLIGFWGCRLWHVRQTRNKATNSKHKAVGQLLKLLPVLRASLEESVRVSEEGVLKASGAVSGMVDGVRRGLSATDKLLSVQRDTRSQSGEAFLKVFENLNKALEVLGEKMKTFEEMSELVLDLERKARDKTLFSVLSELEDISDTIRVVALNATIEGARIGGVGRGFTVVAGEIRRLAGQSEKAVERVRQFGHSLLRDIREKVSGMENNAAAMRTAVEDLARSRKEARDVLALHQEWADMAQGHEAGIAIEFEAMDLYLDEGITAFQFQDAVAQQISHVRDILLRVEKLLFTDVGDGGIDEVNIIKELEEMYTMESERVIQRRALGGAEGAEKEAMGENIEFF